MPRQLKKSEEALVVSVRKDESTAKSYGAARNYLRRSFGVGNIANLRHGAFAEPVISDVAVQIGEELHEEVGMRLHRDDEHKIDKERWQRPSKVGMTGRR
jgi:hypothetical protein